MRWVESGQPWTVRRSFGRARLDGLDHVGQAVADVAGGGPDGVDGVGEAERASATASRASVDARRSALVVVWVVMGFALLRDSSGVEPPA